MPRIPEGEWMKDFEDQRDPSSKENNPSYEELDEEESISYSLAEDIAYVEDRIKYPTTEYGQEVHVTHPDTLQKMLHETKKTIKEKIKDKDMREKLLRRITNTEPKIYQNFIPFIKEQIQNFGYKNSPLEKNHSFEKPNIQDIENDFLDAQDFIKNNKIEKNEEEDIFRMNLDSLHEQLERYQKEPTLFTFEKLEEIISKEMRELDWDESPTTNKDKKYDLWTAKVKNMQEIADRMLDEEIKSNCVSRAKILEEDIENKKTQGARNTHRKMSPETIYNKETWAREILGAKDDASLAEIKKAYLKLIQRYHPDRIAPEKTTEVMEATEKMKEINKAWEILGKKLKP